VQDVSVQAAKAVQVQNVSVQALKAVQVQSFSEQTVKAVLGLVPTVKEEFEKGPVQDLAVHVPETIQQECVTDQCAERTVDVAETVPKVQQQATMGLGLVPTVKEEIERVPVQDLAVHVPETIQLECVTAQCAERTGEVAVPKVQQQAAMEQVLVPTGKEEIVQQQAAMGQGLVLKVKEEIEQVPVHDVAVPKVQQQAAMEQVLVPTGKEEIVQQQAAMGQGLVPKVKEEIEQVPVHEVTVHVAETIRLDSVTGLWAEKPVGVAVIKGQQQAAMVQVLVPTVKEEIVHGWCA